MIKDQEKKELKAKVNDKFMGLSGFVWCVFAGFCYGTMNVFAKLAYKKGLLVTRFTLIRFFTLFLMSYIFGKAVRGMNFDLRKYDKKILLVVFGRSCLSLASKSMQYAAISYIPLSMSSCISFTSGPIFAAILAFVLIREKLRLNEIFPILLGILGTCMITMPEWFLWTGIDSEAISERLSIETKQNTYYYFAIAIAFTSSAMDVVTYFIIRKIGDQIPKAMFPFVSGLLNTTMMLIYIQIYEPLDFSSFMGSTAAPAAGESTQELKPDTTSDYQTAIGLAFVAAFFGWMGLELMVVGLNYSKSALASYGEMMGVTVPFLVDGLVFGRQFVLTDFIGLSLILLLQLYRAFKSMKEAAIEEERKKADKLLEENQDAENEKLYKIQKVDSQDGFRPIKSGIN